MYISIMISFNYKEAFQRNLGLVDEQEQEIIKNTTIAIPGMGGVGGSHLIALVRQGFENFHIADMDEYEVKNINRQYGATTKTINKSKVLTMKERALEINPNCKIKVFEKGINKENIDLFLEDVDISIDGLDFFEVDIRRLFYNKSLKKNIPLITAGPIGFSVASLIFNPKSKYNFDTYFDIDDSTKYIDKLLKFGAGLTPSLLQRPYMKKISLKERKGPSSIGAVNMCSGFVVIQTLKITLQWSNVKYVPYYHQFDVKRDKYICKKNNFGNKNPIQKIKIMVAKKLYNK